MNHKEMIYQYMKEHDGKISEDEARFELGCKRLSARIHDLRMDGVRIGTKTKKTKNMSGETVVFTDHYYLIKEGEANGEI